MVNIKQIINSNKIPQFADKINKYIEDHEEIFKLLDIDFKQFFFDGYLKNQGYIESETKITPDYRVIRLLWFHYCETFDVLQDKNKSYRITLNMLEQLIKMFANSSYEWRQDYSIRIEQLYKNSNAFPSSIDYKLTIYYILNKLKRCILPLIHQIKQDRIDNNDRPKRKYNDSDYEHESNYRNNNNYHNETNNKRERKDKESQIVEVKVNDSILGPEADYFTFLSTDKNPGLAHKQYLNCIESAYYYFKTMYHNPGQNYFEKLLKTEDPDKFHNDNITKLESIYNNFIRSNSNIKTIPNTIITNIPSPMKQPQLPPLHPLTPSYQQYHQLYSPNPSPTNLGSVLTSSPTHFYQYQQSPSNSSGSGSGSISTPNYCSSPTNFQNYNQNNSPRQNVSTGTNGFINNQSTYQSAYQTAYPNHINKNTNQQNGPKEWCEWFEAQDRKLNKSIDTIKKA